jgi:microcystin-dependent protein
MSYTKTTWSSGTAVSPDNLNHAETQYSAFMAGFTLHDHDTLYYTQTQMQAAFWNADNDGTDTGADADLIEYGGTTVHADALRGYAISSGVIILWYGSVGSIPAGWHLCDGMAGTRDLRGKIPIGAGDSYNVAVTGGSTTFSAEGYITIEEHTLTLAELPSHTHSFVDRYSSGSMGAAQSSAPYCTAATYTNRTTSETGGGNGHGHPESSANLTGVGSMPPYLALAYIQKLWNKIAFGFLISGRNGAIPYKAGYDAIMIYYISDI